MLCQHWRKEREEGGWKKRKNDYLMWRSFHKNVFLSVFYNCFLINMLLASVIQRRHICHLFVALFFDWGFAFLARFIFGSTTTNVFNLRGLYYWGRMFGNACLLLTTPPKPCMQFVFCRPNERLLASVFNKKWSKMEEEDRGRKRLKDYKEVDLINSVGQRKTDKAAQSSADLSCCWSYPRPLDQRERSAAGQRDGGSILDWPMTGWRECIPYTAQITASQQGPAWSMPWGFLGGGGQAEVSCRSAEQIPALRSSPLSSLIKTQRQMERNTSVAHLTSQ